MDRTYSVERVQAKHWRVIVRYEDGKTSIVGAVTSRKEAINAARLLAGWRYKVEV